MKLFSSTVPAAVQVVTITLPAPTLSVTPSSGLTGSTFTAALGNLVQGVTYTLDWADGTTEAVTGSGNVARSHVYTSAGTFAVRLTAQGTAPVVGTVTVTNPAPTLSVTPTTADVGATFTAALENLVAGVPYTLDWGDGTTEAVTGSGTTSRLHVYAAPGTFSVRVSARGGVPAVAVVNVTVPAPALNVTPASAVLGDPVTATVSGTVKTVTYTLDWGDGQTEALSGAASYTAKHTYQGSGVYVVRVTAAGVPPVTASVNITAAAPTLSVQPSPGLVGQAITASFGNLKNLQSYTLTWGDASAPETFQGSSAPRTHTYTQSGTFQVQLATPGAAPAVQPEVITYGCTLSQTSGTVQAGQSATFTLSGQDIGGGKLAGFPAGTPYTLDWGDGSAPRPVRRQEHPCR
ncbi:hypothetical protein MF271_17450 (plasmid) [Deinococcus sp. KNUC1210]|uniref:PKD domain-containing protein n=1 Tax=Deinococcus sp. KNUC1210 TaxID=2917691 RepID=UPI001EF0ABDF|nr:hypothetical protein [Deinococcus sp. KNUC1210]ULH16967.1 hypothetical protein MF271_17450 [Deinococcus sp. KNUC1210]